MHHIDVTRMKHLNSLQVLILCMRAHVHIHVELPSHCMLLRGEEADVLHEKGAQEVYVDASMDYVFSCVESEPRDAGTDQRSSGIIRLHTIKQIIDRVRSLTHTYTYKVV